METGKIPRPNPSQDRVPDRVDGVTNQIVDIEMEGPDPTIGYDLPTGVLSGIVYLRMQISDKH